MDKLSSMSVPYRRFAYPLTKWYILIITAIFAIFLFSGTWYARNRDSFDIHRSEYSHPTAAKGPQEEIKALLADHSGKAQSDVAATDDDAAWTDCTRIPGAERVLLIFKTGATEIYNRFPIHMTTTLTCAPKHLVVSDLDHVIGSEEVYDVLKFVTQETRTKHEDFALYHEIQEFYASGQDLHQLSSGAGWNLDKWKFLPMLHKAWDVAQTQHNDTIDWFVMVEGDTSLSWLNLMHYLSKLPDPRTNAQYIGAPARLVLDGSNFAHGGSGILISRAAIAKVEHARNTFVADTSEDEVYPVRPQDLSTKDQRGYDRKWEEHTDGVCCGDAVLAHAFMDVGIPVMTARPMMQGHSPLTLAYDTIDWVPRPKKGKIQPADGGENDDDEGTANLWCKTPITYHHVTPEQVDEMFQFQREWVEDKYGGLWNQTFLYKDIFEKFVLPNVVLDPREQKEKEKQQEFPERQERAAAAGPTSEVGGGEEEESSGVVRSNWDNLSQWWKIETAPPQADGAPGGIALSGPNLKPLPNPADQQNFEQISGASVQSWQNCRYACEIRGSPNPWPAAETEGECVQWRWSSKGSCALDRRVMLGEVQVVGDEGDHEEVVSGWIDRRVRAFVQRKGDCGRGVGKLREVMKDNEKRFEGSSQ